MATENFLDKRKHEYKFNGEYLMIGYVAKMLVLSGILAVIVFLSYTYISRILKRNKFRRIRMPQEYNPHGEPRTEIETVSMGPGQL